MKNAKVFTILFCVTFVVGFIVPFFRESKIIEIYKASISPIANLSGIDRFFYILYRNVRADLATVVAGILFGVVPFLSVVFNGYVIGLTFNIGSSKMGYVNAAKAIFPHGIFEVIAMIIAASYGLQLGKVFHRWLKQKNAISLKQSTAKAVKINVMIGIPLLVIAAFIETYVTPYLYSRIP